MAWGWAWRSAKPLSPGIEVCSGWRVHSQREAHFTSCCHAWRRQQPGRQYKKRHRRIETNMTAKKVRIVTADDDPQLLRLIARNLEFEGYEVLTASDGALALEQIERSAPDLVLLDVMMPKMDGFTVTSRVREFSPVPIIIVTARGQDQDKVKGLDLGADDYLTKPFSVEELL